MSKIPIVCPRCGKKLRVPESAAGKKGKCPKCGEKFIVVVTATEEEEFFQQKEEPEGELSQSTNPFASSQSDPEMYEEEYADEEEEDSVFSPQDTFPSPQARYRSPSGIRKPQEVSGRGFLSNIFLWGTGLWTLLCIFFGLSLIWGIFTDPTNKMLWNTGDPDIAGGVSMAALFSLFVSGAIWFFPAIIMILLSIATRKR